MTKSYYQVDDKSAGDGFTEAMWDNFIKTNMNNLLVRPYAQARLASANQTIPDATFTIVNFDTQDYDTDGMWSGSPTPARITPTTEGLYLFIAQVTFDTSGSGARLLTIVNSNGPAIAEQRQTTAISYSSTKFQCIGLAYMNGSTDYADCRVYQDSGGGLDILTDSDGAGNSVTRFQAIWLGLPSF